MRAFAPGKLVLTGAYAVLEGAPAIVVATSRGAYADASRIGHASIEVKAAIGDAPAPLVDTSELYVEGRKLGLGASSAALVASLAARDLASGADVTGDAARRDLFTRARTAHAAAQGGGSGVDVAASVYGGALRYVMGAVPRRVDLPGGCQVAVFACQNSARTSELRGRVDALAKSAPSVHRAHLDALKTIARDAADAVDAGQREGFVDAVARAGDVLAALGRDAGAPIVPPEVAELATLARSEGAAFCVSGAGGGDVAVHVSVAPPSRSFVERAAALGLSLLDVAVDVKGVRSVTELPTLGRASLSAQAP